MNENIKKLVCGMELNSITSSDVLLEVGLKLGIKLPDQYISFMMDSNGAEGNIGSSYLAIWTTEQIVQLNKEYEVSDFTPGLVYFGSDGGEMAYAFDNRLEKITIVEFPFESISIEDVKLCGTTFTGFLKHLYDQE